MGVQEVNAFLSALATERDVSASTQGQALCALIFLYRYVLDDPLPWIDELVRAQRPARLPVVLTMEEARSVLDRLEWTPLLVAQLLCGSGLRLLEARRLPIKDIDFGRRQIFVRDPKGRRDRATMLPRIVIDSLKGRLERVRAVYEEDVRQGFGVV